MVMPAPYKNVFLELSGVCNARCPYCLSGRYRTPGGGFIAVDDFERILERLRASRLIDRTTLLGLYNWGEPFLHPRLGELVTLAQRYGMRYSFSTNASVVPAVDASFVQGLAVLIFSMPGFSQASYDRIHGFDFAKVRGAIETIVRQARAAGYRGGCRIHYHVYQFNLAEMDACAEFARRLEIDVEYHYAILNHWGHLWAYLDDELPYPLLKEVSQDLFNFRLRELSADSVSSYRCPQYDTLAVDESANVLLCCQVPKEKRYVAGNLLRDDIGQILDAREHNETCTRCVERGVARYLNTALEFPQMRRPRSRRSVRNLWARLGNRFA
jgi:MoaA/NifB/PqqE/SkfB family radical SAM enzyme